MAKVRTITKNLAGTQDLLLGKGQVSQARGEGTYDINKLRVPTVVETPAELVELDPEQFPEAILVYEGEATLYTHDGTDWVVSSYKTGIHTGKTLQEQTSNVKLKVGDYVITTGYNANNDGGEAAYIVVPKQTSATDKGSYINVNQGSAQLKLISTNPKIEVFGAILDGVADVSQSFIDWMTYTKTCVLSEGTYFFDDTYISQLTSKRIDIPTGVSITGNRNLSVFKTNIKTGISDPTTDRVLFYINGTDNTMSGFTFDGTGCDIEKVITLGLNAKNPTVEKLNFKNINSSRYLWTITVNAGIDNYNLDRIHFESLSVADVGVEGGQLGSLRGIYVGYDEVGGDPGAALGYGDITNISGIDLTPYQDTDLVQVISNSGSTPFSHYSPIKIAGIRGKNVGKRLVKCQLNGVSVEDVYADAQNITHSVGYMFAIVAALNGSTTVRNVRGKGKFKTGIECKDESFVEDVHIISDYGSTEVLSGTHVLILNEGGKTSRATIDLTNIRTSGYWRSLLLNRENGYGDTTKINIDNMHTENSTVDYCIGIFADTQINNIEKVDLKGLTLGTLSNVDPVILTTSDNGTSQNIDKVNITDVDILGSNSMPVSIDIRAAKASVSNVSDNTNSSNIVQAVCPEGIILKNIREESTIVQSKRIANLSGCNNSFVQGCYSPFANTQAVRVSGGNNVLITNNVLAPTIFPYTAVGGATNVQEFNNYNFV